MLVPLLLTMLATSSPADACAPIVGLTTAAEPDRSGSLVVEFRLCRVGDVDYLAALVTNRGWLPVTVEKRFFFTLGASPVSFEDIRAMDDADLEARGVRSAPPRGRARLGGGETAVVFGLRVNSRPEFPRTLAISIATVRGLNLGGSDGHIEVILDETGYRQRVYVH